MSTTAFKQVADNAKTTTSTDLSSTGVTHLNFAAGTGLLFPQPGNGFILTIWNNSKYPGDPGSDPNMEKVTVTARVTDAVTITPTTKTHSNNSAVALLDVAQNTTDLQTAVNAAETAITTKEPAITAGTTAQYYRGDKSFQTLNTTAVPEGTNLYFTNGRASAAAPVQTVAGRTGAIVLAEPDITNLTTDLAAKAALVSPTFTGTPAAPTATLGTNTTQLATTAFVAAAGTALGANYVLKAGDTMAGALNVGAMSTTPLTVTNPVFNASGTANGTVQLNIQNQSSGTSASGDVVATADTGTDSTNYIDMGINSSTYSDSSYTITGSLDGYLYTNGGSLAIGTQSSGKTIKFHTGGTLASNLRLAVSDAGLQFGSSAQASIGFTTGQTRNTLMIGADSTTKSILIVDQANISNDYLATNGSHPTLYIYSAASAATSTTQFLSFSHDNFNAQVRGNGGFVINMATITQNMQPNNNLTYAIGTTSFYYTNMYSTVYNLNATASISGATAGVLAVTGSVTVSSGITISGDLTMDTNNLTWTARIATPAIAQVRNTSTSGANFSITTQAAHTGGTDLNGGSLILSSGISTGAGASTILFKTAASATTGSADNALSTRITIDQTGAFYPAVNNTQNLGTGSLYWSNIYASRLNINSTAYLDGATAGSIVATGKLTVTGTSSAAGFNFGAGSTPTTPVNGDMWISSVDGTIMYKDTFGNQYSIQRANSPYSYSNFSNPNWGVTLNSTPPSGNLYGNLIATLNLSNASGYTTPYSISNKINMGVAFTATAVSGYYNNIAYSTFNPTITSVYGFFQDVTTAASNTASLYGMYIGNQTGAAANYALFTNTGIVRFGDSVGHLTSAPTHTYTQASTGTGIALYNTSDQTTNLERGLISWSGSVFTIATQNGGTGTLRQLKLQSGSSTFTITNASAAFVLDRSASGSSFIGTSLTGTISTTSSYIGLNVAPTINQTSAAAYTAFVVNPTESGTGSGAKLLADFQVGGSSKLNIDNTGHVTMVGQLQLSAPVAVSSTGNTALTTRYELATTGATNITRTLYTPVGHAGEEVYIQKIDSGAGIVTIATAAGSILGGTTTLSNQFKHVTYLSDGTNWYVKDNN